MRRALPLPPVGALCRDSHREHLDPGLPRLVYRADPHGSVAPRLPFGVLISLWSASSADVVAAALRDNGRAPRVGESTSRNGLVGTVRALPKGGALLLTTVRQLTPVGTDSSRVGVTPAVAADDNASTPGADAPSAAAEVVTFR